MTLCPTCGNAFTPRATGGTRQRFCSTPCWRTQYGPDSATQTCREPDCTRPLRARGMCNTHYKRWSRAEGRTKPTEWNDRRRDNYHARRARAHGAHNGDRALLSEIIARDGTNCRGCGEPVDLAIEWPDPKSKSIDHTHPLSKGGAHSLANTQLMHLDCNTRKGASLPTPTHPRQLTPNP